MDDIKNPTTYKQQIEILRSRGCIIQNETKALGYLDNKNYYPKHKHTEFLSRIEDEKRKRINNPAASSGVCCSLNVVRLGFNTFRNAAERRGIKPSLRIKETFVQHHINKYGSNFPIWVMIELFTFGTLSHFYSDLPIRDQKYIAQRFFKAHYKTLASWLKCCTDLRNFCAHFGRLYFRRFTSIPAGIPEIDKTNERSLFAVIMILKYLYRDSAKWNTEVYTPLSSLFSEYKASIQLSCIGFPADWEEKVLYG